MKYMLLIYGNDDVWAKVQPEDIAATDAHNEELRQSGELIGAYGIGDPSITKLVRLVDGAPVMTDGPYIEAKEHLGSFTIVDCESAERAYEIAALNPFARVGTVEVKPIMHEAGEAI